MADLKVLEPLISKELYAQINEALKDNNAKFADLSTGKYADADKVAKAEARVKELDTQLAEAASKIDEFQKLEPDKLKASADEWKAKYEAAEQTYKQEKEASELNTALKALAQDPKHRLKYPDLFLEKLDKTKIVKDGEKFIGFEDAVKAYVEKYPDLQLPETGENPTIVTGQKGQVKQTPDLFNFIPPGVIKKE